MSYSERNLKYNWTYTSENWEDGEEEIEILCHEEPDCEHCRELEPYDIVFSHYTTYCEDCMNANNALPPDDMLKQAKEHSLKCKIEYFTERIEACKKELEEL